MSSTSDTSAIDEKKEEETITDENLPSNIGKFLITLLIIVFILILNFSAGGFVLYGCKVGQANILPTDEKCMPYENNIPSVQPIQINIFDTFTDPPLSQKISFPYAMNNKSTILDMLRDYKQKPDSNYLLNYLISILESLFIFNFSSLNTFLNLLNQAPESLIILFGPSIMMFCASILILINFFYVIYLWFYQMSWFFSVNTNTSDKGKPKWENTIDPVKLGIGCFLVFVFSILFWIGLLLIPFIPLIPPLIMAICVFTTLSCKGEMNNKVVSVLSIIKDVFKYNKLTVSSVITFFVILCAFANLGGLAGGLSILTVVLIYFGILSIDIFNPINEDNLSNIVSYDQAKRTCKVQKEFEMKSFFKSMMPWSGGGKKLTHEIKKIGSKLNK
jgi:hypothetical protein